MSRAAEWNAVFSMFVKAEKEAAEGGVISTQPLLGLQIR
jgi:hypothetical protein